MGNQQVQYLISEVALGALATLSVAGTATIIDAARLQGMRIKKAKVGVTFKDKTAGEGPLLVGMASVDLSNAEIAEALVADPQSARDSPANERANRQIYPIAMLPAGLAHAEEVQYLRTLRYPWKRIMEGNGLKMFVFNMDTATLTTGCVVNFVIPVVGNWDD